MLATEPRQHTPVAAQAFIGMPGDRHACQAALQAFAELKQTFMQALADVEEPRFDGLRHHVRSAEEPLELWLLRAPVFAALSRPDPDFRRRRQLVRRALDAVFQDGEPAPAFSPV